MSKIEGLFSIYPTFEELESALKTMCTEFPNLTNLVSAGKSLKGRELWVVEATNKATSPASQKPGLWIDGNTHSGEVTGSVVCLKTIWHLLKGYGEDPSCTEILDDKVIYIMPRVNPDGAEIYLTQSYHSTAAGISNPSFLDGEGHYDEDVDDDGKILFMRITNPNGEWKVSKKDPRLMVKREPNEHYGEFYDVLREGKFLKYKNGKEVTMAPPRFLGGTNRNYPAHWAPGGLPIGGAGVFPLEEVEARAIADFWAKHPNIGGMHTFHTSGGLILRESAVHPDSWFTDQDLDLDLAIYKYLASIGENISGYPAISIFEEFTFADDRPFRRGCATSFFYEHLGAFVFSIELWDWEHEIGLGHFRQRGGIEFSFDRLPEEDQLRELKWIDHNYPEAFVPWHKMAHPQLGEVEVGGIDTKVTRRNPPPGVWLEREVDKVLPFALRHAALLPLLRVREARMTNVSEDVYKVEAQIVNAGWLPTNVTQIATRIKRATPVIAEIILPPGAELVVGHEKIELGHLEGHSAKLLLPRVVGGEVVDKTKAHVEWVIKARKSVEVEVVARCARAGTHRVKITLP
ncbi:MAG: M14 family metallopeptidase [Candidatus Bathyarchaeia archaeon]